MALVWVNAGVQVDILQGESSGHLGPHKIDEIDPYGACVIKTGRIRATGGVVAAVALEPHVVTMPT